ncbi:MAG: hypothetical protein RH917_00230 [Lacipirellulaceae bacterium]
MVTDNMTVSGGLGKTKGLVILELSETSYGANDQIAVCVNLNTAGTSSNATVTVIPAEA